MFNAKNNRAAKYKVFDQDLRARAFARFKTEADLRRALEQGEFTVVYQPEVSLKSGKVVAFEALVRWKHPEQGLVHASEIIPIAEETGLILPIGRLMLDKA